MKLSSGSLTDRGRKREQNQDSVLDRSDLGIFAVADGMGGHTGGETASRIAVETLERAYSSAAPEADADSAAKQLEKAIKAANENIQKMGVEKPELRGMGTTASVLRLKANGSGMKAYVGQVGDSRAYFLQNGQMWQLTRDHSLVQEKVRAGILTREQAKTARDKNVITRSVGYESSVEPDVFWIDAKPGDMFMICSDGLHGLVTDSAIRDLIIAHSSDLSSAAKALIDAANANGGNDNVTAVIVRVDG